MHAHRWSKQFSVNQYFASPTFIMYAVDPSPWHTLRDFSSDQGKVRSETWKVGMSAEF